MRVIVDTNVPVVANGKSDQASPECVLSCVRRLREIQQKLVLVIDDGWLILREYQGNLQSSGQPGVGDAFLKWVLTNLANPKRCEQLRLDRRAGSPPEDDEFDTFPEDDALGRFDRSDRKFVALCLAHPEHPPIQNAADPDWWEHRAALARHGVQVEFLCPEVMQRLRPGGP